MRLFFNVFFIAFLSISPAFSADKALSFSQAKRLLSENAHRNNLRTFYCDCEITWKNNKGSPEPSSCGYSPRKPTTKSGRINRRTHRVEWEHVMPAYRFSKHLSCWADGGRKLCRKDPTFNLMEGDLNNLVPIIGELNGDRSNYRFGVLSSEKRAYGRCDFEISFKERIVEPKESIRGDIARIYFYMRDTYKVSLDQSTLELMNDWDKADPVSIEEIKHNINVIKIGGNKNIFLYRDQLETHLPKTSALSKNSTQTKSLD